MYEGTKIPDIKIKTTGITALYYIKDNKYIEITEKDSNNNYIYIPQSHNTFLLSLLALQMVEIVLSILKDNNCGMHSNSFNSI